MELVRMDNLAVASVPNTYESPPSSVCESVRIIGREEAILELSRLQVDDPKFGGRVSMSATRVASSVFFEDQVVVDQGNPRSACPIALVHTVVRSRGY